MDVNIYNSEELKTVVTKLETLSAKESNKIWGYYALGINCKNDCLIERLYLYHKIIKERYDNLETYVSKYGTGTAHIGFSLTDDQFMTVLVAALNLIN